MTEERPRYAASAAQSSTSTNLNTPRSPKSPTPDQNQVLDDGSTEASPSPKSTASGASQHDIQRTWPMSIDLTKLTAVAAWGDNRLPNLSLDIHWQPGSRQAFFKLRVTVAVSEGGGRRDGRASTYIYIHPERISQLSVDLDPTEKTFGGETVSLSFEMARPPTLVTPKTPCVPKTRGAQEVMDACRGVAGQKVFKIYASIPRRKMSVRQIQELCAAATGAGLSSLSAHADTASLYLGTGGQIVEGDTLTGPVQEASANAESLPQYSEMNSGTTDGSKGKKRRRVESSSPEPTPLPSLEAIQTLMDANLFVLKQHLDERLASHKKYVAQLLDRTETRILKTLREEMDERHEVLLQMVNEEMAEAEDNIMRNLSEAPMSATLTFPHHPWY